MSVHRIPATGMGKPLLVLPLFVALAIAGAALPRLLGLHYYGQQAIDRQIDREDSSLCERFGFAPGGKQNDDCKTALADLRRQHEALRLY
jgi:hypothetical protein